ncbi:hypothetical protein Zmor_005040 [Zophobas morio]|uniref:Odorant receptor n=1 Tax=Zophobas morio TaxID=2755281 RepID=A0AA38IX41_9CUCU|nr:hypothetical protein Zmor_005040 [Zophobas morio]
MTFKKILESDSLFAIVILPRILAQHKVVQKISYFYFVFIIGTAFGAFIVVVATNQWYQVFTRYVDLAGGFFIAQTSYMTMYIPIYIKMFWDIYEQMFPRLWPLDYITSNNKFTKISNLIKIGALIITVAVLVFATAALPWRGDEYYLYFPVKMAVDYFNIYLRNLYLFFFYTCFYHVGLTIISNLFCLTYLILHLYNQYCMLSEKLKTLSDYKQQDLVTQELILCIKLHQTLLEYVTKLNNLMYYPIYCYSASGVITVLTIILYPKNSLVDVLESVFVTIITICVAAGFCFLGQIIEDSSEEASNSAYSTTWYKWNAKNRRLLLFFLQQTQRKAVLTSSGVITVNYQLLIRVS